MTDYLVPMLAGLNFYKASYLEFVFFVPGDVEIGELACDHLFGMEAENTGNYIAMANLYSHAGRWKEADMVRERMKSIGLKKIAGSSWIETGEGLRSFISTDSSIERSEEIYSVLEGLVGSLRVEGYVYQEELDEDNPCCDENLNESAD